MLETDPSTSGKRTARAPLAGQPRETLPCFGGNDTVPEGENGAQPRSSTPKAALSQAPTQDERGVSGKGNSNVQGQLACCSPTTNQARETQPRELRTPRCRSTHGPFWVLGTTGKSRHFGAHPYALQAQTDFAVLFPYNRPTRPSHRCHR